MPHNLLFHVTSLALKVGDTRPPGSYGESLRAESMSLDNDPLGEFLRELVRSESYSDKPSRLKSNFAFETLEDAVFFRDSYRVGEKIYEVQFEDAGATQHRVCWSAWNMAHPNLDLQAHEYWRSPPLYNRNTEVFSETGLLIVGEVQPCAQAGRGTGPAQ